MELPGEVAPIRRRQRQGGTQQLVMSDMVQEVVIVDTPRTKELDKTYSVLRSKLARLISRATELGKKESASPSGVNFTLVEKSEHNTVRSEIAQVGTLLGKVGHERPGAIVVKGKTSI